MAIAYLAGQEPFADRDQSPYPTVILLDLKLPRRSGFEVLEWLRAQPGLRRLPVVVLTSSGQTEDVNRAYDLGANSYPGEAREGRGATGDGEKPQRLLDRDQQNA